MTSAAAIAVALTVASPSQAAVHYYYELIVDNGAGVQKLGEFTYTTDNFITADRNVAPGDLDSCSPIGGPPNTCQTQQFRVDTTGFSGGKGDIYDIIGFSTKFAVSTSTSFHYFAEGAFGAVGVYNATVLDNDLSRLTVTQDAVAAAPEPATWGLMVLGFGGLGAALRRRTRIAAV